MNQGPGPPALVAPASGGMPGSDMSDTSISAAGPVAIGGVGGSGTRLIARIARELGFFMGADLNEAGDNLWFTLLFKRRELLSAGADADFSEVVEIFSKVMSGGGLLSDGQVRRVRQLARDDRVQHPAAWLAERADALLAGLDAARLGSAWGWKEPNTHVFLDRLQARFPTLKYIHVMRHGVDMALSANQNQLLLWGSQFLGQPDVSPTPRLSLAYWCVVHRRVMLLGERMPDRFMLLNYDAFCADPRSGLDGLLRFLGRSVSSEGADRLLALVRPPESIGRHAQSDADAFDRADLDFVRALGYELAFSGHGLA